MKRLCIYFIYDSTGFVDRYILAVLREMRPHVADLLVVSNGKLQAEGIRGIESITDKVIIRENTGFDVWAYKTALDSVGWDGLAEYDEVILMNYTLIGPIFPLDEMFSEMSRRDLDFWGVTKCFRLDSDECAKAWGNPLGYIPEHIQSSFMAYRRRFVSSDEFRRYWDEMRPIKSYQESGALHEQMFTKRFADKGFVWDCYTDYSKAGFNPAVTGGCPLVTCPLECVRDLGTPFVKRRSFFTSLAEFPSTSQYRQELLDYLRDECKFDVSLIYDCLIRSYHQRTLANSLVRRHFLEG